MSILEWLKRVYFWVKIGAGLPAKISKFFYEFYAKISITLWYFMQICLEYYAILCQFCFTFYAILCYWNRNLVKTLKLGIISMVYLVFLLLYNWKTMVTKEEAPPWLALTGGKNLKIGLLECLKQTFFRINLHEMTLVTKECFMLCKKSGWANCYGPCSEMDLVNRLSTYKILYFCLERLKKMSSSNFQAESLCRNY